MLIQRQTLSSELTNTNNLSDSTLSQNNLEKSYLRNSIVPIGVSNSAPNFNTGDADSEDLDDGQSIDTDWHPLLPGEEFRTRYRKLRNLRTSGELIAKESEEIVKVQRWAYVAYIKAAGGSILYFMVTLCMTCFIFCQIYGNNLLLEWANLSPSEQQTRFEHFTIYLVVFGALTAIFVFIRVSLLVNGNLRAIKSLHNKMLAKVLNAPINLYFDITPIGQILNRFSKDLMIMDSSLVFSISGFYGTLFNALASLTVAIIVVPYIIVAVVIMLVIAILIFRYCLEGYNQCYRLESVTRSPILSQLQETLAGSTVIRAFDQNSQFDQKNVKLVNNNILAN
jgi:ABC-type multidrug transport system fused ATPase/permease subunit